MSSSNQIERRIQRAQEALDKRARDRDVAFQHHRQHARKPRTRSDDDQERPMRQATHNEDDDGKKSILPPFRIKKRTNNEVVRSSDDCDYDEEMWPWYLIFTIIIILIIIGCVAAVMNSSKQCDNSPVPVVVKNNPWEPVPSATYSPPVSTSLVGGNIEQSPRLSSSSIVSIQGGDNASMTSSGTSDTLSTIISFGGGDTNFRGGANFNRSEALSNAMLTMPTVPYDFAK